MTTYGVIHHNVPETIARYDYNRTMTRYTRAEVEAAFADLQAADAALTEALERAETVLAPHRVDMGLWSEIQDERYQRLETLTLADVRWAQAGKIVERYPLTEWAKCAASWRRLAARITREIERLQHMRAS